MEFEVRPYQQEAIADCLKVFTEDNRSSVLLESPVGSGKTYMALEVIHRFQEHLGRRLKVAWVAPRLRLLQQMQEANANLHRDCILPVSLFDRNPPKADLLVLDEAHHEATQSAVLLYEKVAPKWAIGLSATPLRTDRMRLSFQDTVHTCSIARLIREGYLSPFNSHLIPEYTVDCVAEHYLADPQRWGKSLVFFSTIAECLDFRGKLAAGGVACEVVTAESDKEAQMELFASGKVPVIANVAMLTEGFDQPDVQTVFVRDGSRLPVIQMGGRGLRKAPGKAACNIVQSGNSSYQFERVASPKNAFRFQRGHWLALKDGTEEIEATLKESIRRLASLQEKDRKKRKADYQQAAEEAPGRFTRAIERLNETEKREREFFGHYGSCYHSIQAFMRHVNNTYFNGSLPPIVLHLEKTRRTWQSIVHVEEAMDKTSEGLRPAITLLLCKFWKIAPSRFGLELLRGLVEVARKVAGLPPYSQQELVNEMGNLGWFIDRHRVKTVSPAGEVANLAREAFVGTIPALQNIRFASTWTSRRSEIAFFEKGEHERLAGSAGKIPPIQV